MKLKDIAKKISQHPVVTIKAGTVVLANRIKTAELGSESEIETYLTELLKNSANPNALVEVELRNSNGANASIFKEKVYLDKDEMPSAAVTPAFVIPPVGLAGNGNDIIYQMQLQLLSKQLAEAEDKAKRLSRENDDLYNDNRKMRVELDTFEAKREMENTLGAIEQKTSLAGVFDKLLESGTIDTIVTAFMARGNAPNAPAGGEANSEVAAVIASMIGHLPLEHQQQIVGIVKVYASVDIAHAKELLQRIAAANATDDKTNPKAA